MRLSNHFGILSRPRNNERKATMLVSTLLPFSTRLRQPYVWLVASGVATVLVENAVPSERIGSREYELSYLFKRIVSPPQLNLPTPLLGHSTTCNLALWDSLTTDTRNTHAI